MRQAYQQKKHLLLTPRTIRRDIELRFSLEPGTLDSEEYKRPVRRAIESAIVSLDEGADDCAELESSLKKKSKSVQLSSTKATKGLGVQRPTLKRKREGPVKEYKSAAIITSSDEEGELDSTSQGGPFSKGLGTRSTEEFHDCQNSSYKRPKIAQADGGQIRETTSSVVQNPQDGVKSESMISASLDEARHRKKERRITNQESRGKSAQTKKAKKPTSSLSKNEATIKRLKSFVAACGVRKVWSKVFENIDVPAQQIKMLREILAELGMTGRLSLEQAKRIKENRELAKELEDVRSFHRSVVDQAYRDHKTPKPDNTEMDSDADTEEAEGVPSVPMRRKRTAFQSIAAFLEDQSDDG